ncbi:hypothetical protein L1049_001358 [Liquidambar formosana]|uniref:NB-ARC domain-containing protein n=1 Tax=Liquidambar formosana TaxID=63359 RepID=A0AAP0NAG3_LIQFO
MNEEIISIGVYGMGGVGKTAIITHIHNQLLETFDHVYWVTVSQESNVRKLQNNIAKAVRLDLSDKQDERQRAAKLNRELKKKLKFVLILDDMWKDIPLEDVGIPVGVNAGKVIVTSRSLEVCRRMNCKPNIKVKPLPKGEAWELFMEKFGRETVLAPEVEKIAESIANECAGLPLAIITTARSMRGVDDICEWRNALNDLRELTRGLIDMEGEVFNLLKFSYDRLNDEKLQQCLLYCALFPEDYNIQREYLIMCWIAEGLVDEMKTRQAEFDRGHALLNKLENVCLLERPTSADGKLCIKMHDVIRDMALNIARVNPQFMVKAGVQLMQLPDERGWSENLDRVSFMHNNIEGRLPYISPKCPKLRTMMLQSNGIKEIPNLFFVYMQNLEVLDLSQNKSIKRLPDSISNLEKLRALLLNGCQNLMSIPSLAKLTELRELDLEHTKIKELPHGTEKLANLKRLDLPLAYGTAFVFPSGVLSKLFRLQSLRFVLFTDDLHVEEISRLKQMEVLVVHFYNFHTLNSYVKTQHWQRLDHYSLQTVSRHFPTPEEEVHCCREVHMNECNLIEGEGPLVLPTNIQELNIYAFHDLASLSDFSSLKNARELEKCCIQSCKGIKHLWSWSIPSLEEEPEWCTETTISFLQSLKTLMLLSLPKLSVIFNFKGVGVGRAPPKCRTFSNLKFFRVGDCPNLKYVFQREMVQHHLQNLEEIQVYECSNMEDIIVAEQEEKQEEIVAAKEEDSNSIITCPKLQNLELINLPKLKSIWRGTMVCHSLQQIDVRRCLMLRRLPFSPHLNVDAQPSATLLTPKKISGEEDWWNCLEWDHPDTKSAFQPFFCTIVKVELRVDMDLNDHKTRERAEKTAQRISDNFSIDSWAKQMVVIGEVDPKVFLRKFRKYHPAEIMHVGAANWA